MTELTSEPLRLLGKKRSPRYRAGLLFSVDTFRRISISLVLRSGWHQSESAAVRTPIGFFLEA